MTVRHVVTLWGVRLNGEEELDAYMSTTYDENGDAVVSPFVQATGVPELIEAGIDDDFMEVHLIANEEEREQFAVYLREEYAEPAFHAQLTDDLLAQMKQYPAIVLLHGNDSPYDAINEALFAVEGGHQTGHDMVELIARIVYASRS